MCLLRVVEVSFGLWRNRASQVQRLRIANKYFRCNVDGAILDRMSAVIPESLWSCTLRSAFCRNVTGQ